MNNNVEQLRPLWRSLLSVYEEYRVICNRYGLKFYAAYGTALGAVRHNGFIPWDDDFDVEMLREDYDKFLSIPQSEFPSWLRVVSYGRTFGYTNLFSKVMICDERIVHDVEVACGHRLPQGIFIDVFVVDGLPNSLCGRIWNFARRAVIKAKEKRIFPFRFFLRNLRMPKDYCAAHEKIMRENPTSSSVMIHEIGWLTLLKKCILRWRPLGIDYYGEPKWLKFEDTQVPVCQKVDECLKFKYGDYMKLPPESCRVPSHCDDVGDLPWRLGRVMLRQQPLISIVVANYNYGRFLESAFSSIASQCWGTAWGDVGQNVLVMPTGESIELIVCDAGSTDESVAIIKKYSDQIAWWCSEKDSGQSDAFNKGFSHARGRYLTWLNADDMYVKGSLSKVVAEMNRHKECEWFTGNYFRFVPNGRIFQMNWGPNYYPKWLQWKSSPVQVFGPTSFFTKEIFEAAGRFDVNLHNAMDTNLWLTFINNGVKQRRIRALCWAFRMHEASKTADYPGHVRDQALRERGAAELKRIYSKPNFARPKFPMCVIKIWRIFDGSFVYKCYLSARYWRASQFIDV